MPMIVSTWLGLIGTQWVQYAIIKHYLSLKEVGLYSLASQVAGVVQQITIISSSLLLPHFSVLVANEQVEEIKILVGKAAPYGFIGFSLVLSGCVLLAGEGIPLIFGFGFSEAVPPLIVLMVATMGLALFNTFMPLVSAYGLTWVLTGITFVSAFVNFLSALLLVPRYGVNGAAIATVLGYGSAAAMMLAVVQNRLSVPILRLGLLGIPVLVVVLCASFLRGEYLYIVGIAGMVLTTYVLVHAFGLFERGDLTVLARANIPMIIKSGLMKVLPRKTNE